MIRRLRSALGRLLWHAGYGRGPLLMSALRKRWVLLCNPHANIQFLGPVYLGPGFSLHIPANGSFIVGPRCDFRRGFRAEVQGDGELVVGADCVFTYYVLVQCSTRIEIGDHCMFGQSSMVVDGNHRFRDLDTPMLQQGYEFRPLRLADHVTVTTKCTIIADIGERAFIGANSVVTRPIPAFTVATGSPAEVRDYFGPAGGEPEGFEAGTAG